jgi:hypothetical protein
VFFIRCCEFPCRPGRQTREPNESGQNCTAQEKLQQGDHIRAVENIFANAQPVRKNCNGKKIEVANQ